MNCICRLGRYLMLGSVWWGLIQKTVLWGLPGGEWRQSGGDCLVGSWNCLVGTNAVDKTMVASWGLWPLTGPTNITHAISITTGKIGAGHYMFTIQHLHLQSSHFDMYLSPLSTPWSLPSLPPAPVAASPSCLICVL